MIKGAAKCDKHAELQGFVNQQGLECKLCSRGVPEGVSASVSFVIASASCPGAHIWHCCMRYVLVHTMS